MSRAHIIAAKSPSGDQLTSARSTALDDRVKSSNPFDETRRSILARLSGPPVHAVIDDSPIVSPAQAIVMVLVAVLIGVLLGTGGAL